MAKSWVPEHHLHTINNRRSRCCSSPRYNMRCVLYIAVVMSACAKINTDWITIGATTNISGLLIIAGGPSTANERRTCIERISHLIAYIIPMLLKHIHQLVSHTANKRGRMTVVQQSPTTELVGQSVSDHCPITRCLANTWLKTHPVQVFNSCNQRFWQSATFELLWPKINLNCNAFAVARRLLLGRY